MLYTLETQYFLSHSNIGVLFIVEDLVRKERLELSWVAPLEPKSSAYAISPLSQREVLYSIVGNLQQM